MLPTSTEAPFPSAVSSVATDTPAAAADGGVDSPAPIDTAAPPAATGGWESANGNMFCLGCFPFLAVAVWPVASSTAAVVGAGAMVLFAIA